MNLFIAIILLVIGLTILVKGADWLVDGSVSLARHFHISPLVIGLTIVAMGTSAPEVAAGISFALSGASDAVVGNVYGSNIANIAFVGGLCALIRPIAVTSSALKRDIPILLLVSAILYIIFHNLQASRLECVLMFLFFAGIVYFMISTERRKSAKASHLFEQFAETAGTKSCFIAQTVFGDWLLIFFGLLCLAAGAKLTQSNAEYIGHLAGLSDAVIGSTIIAVGTSSPELITCLIASFKGHDDLSIGNIVGSNIFNSLLAISAAGIAKPLFISHRMVGYDYLWLLLVTIIFSVFAFTFRKIHRTSGIVLLCLYGCYLAYLFYCTG